MTITIVIINPKQEMRLECGWRHAQKRWAENLEDFWKRFSWGPTMVLKSWGPTTVLKSWGPTTVLKSWGPTIVLRSWSLTMELRIWNWTMQADNSVSAIGADNWVICHSVAFSTVAAAVKFCRSRPAKMNWDVKHYEMCRTLGVLLA